MNLGISGRVEWHQASPTRIALLIDGIRPKLYDTATLASASRAYFPLRGTRALKTTFAF